MTTKSGLPMRAARRVQSSSRTAVFSGLVLSAMVAIIAGASPGSPRLPQVQAGAGQWQPPAQMTHAHFHHVHMNVTDPAGAIEFYTGKFDCEKRKFAGLMDAVWAQKSWILFNKVKDPPPWNLTSAIWHIGWGAEDMKA
ncbi:MAG TPA: VOC family protein, partial [Blastocatellia bacterium]|nr:VOC family protein [Blastocatellia bacterium]